MSGKFTQCDPGGGLESNVRPLRTPYEAVSGSVVLTDPFRRLQATGGAFVNSAFGINMNIALDTGGADEPVFTETDTGDWTFSQPVGSGVTISSDRAQTGTFSIDADPLSLNEVFQLNGRVDKTASDYTNLTFGINVDRRWDAANEEAQVYAWDTGTGAVVGDRVNLTDYFTPTNNDVWQNVVIPLTDLGLTGSTTFNALRWELTEQNNTAPEFFIDNISLREAGAPVTFRYSAPKGDKVYVYGVRLVLADAHSVAVTNGTVPGLNPSGLLGLSQLANGIVIRRRENGETLFSAAARNLQEFMSGSGFIITNVISDDTNTYISMEAPFSDPAVIEGHPDDNHIDFVIQDDMDGLTLLQGWVKASKEFL